MTETTTDTAEQERGADPAAAREATPEPGAATGAVAGAPSLVASVLKLQRSAGNRATTAALSRRAARNGHRRLARAVWADLFDYDALAAQIHEGGAGSGTDEVKIFQALERLQRDPAAIARLDAAYRRRYNHTLEWELRDELGDGDLNFALQLINRGGNNTAQVIWGPPNGPAYHAAAADRIHRAVQSSDTDEAAIYATLMPYQRRADLIDELARAYRARYGEQMRARLHSELQSDEFSNARYLMGEQVLEQAVLSLTQVNALYEMMAALRFQNTRGEWVPVPYHYPRDGCYARAHMMSQVMTAAGFANERMFATSTVIGRPLSVLSDYSSEPPAGWPVPPGPASTQWFYHVAPMVRVNNNGRTEMWVIDPSTQPRAVPYQTWLATMGVSAVNAAGQQLRPMTHQELQRHLASTRADTTPGRVGSFRGGEQLFWTADRNTMSPEQMPSTDAARADRDLTALRGRMTGYADDALVNELAAEIRGLLRAPSTTGPQVVAAIRRRPPPVRGRLWGMFARLYAECTQRFPSDRMALDAAVQP